MTIAAAIVRKLESGRSELGEGPHYDISTDTAWWFDIVGKKLFEHSFATEETVEHALPRMASVISTIDENRQLLAMEDGLYLRHKSNGSLDLLHSLEADNAATRSNDGRVHPSGNLWIGTMSKRADREAGAIYWFNGQETRLLFPRISIPNSICFSPDGKVGYFADTAINTVWRIALDAATGLPLGNPEVFLTGSDLPLGGSFDGSVTDADGNVWNAAWGGGSVTGFAPNGSVLETYEAPAAQTSCPCFVGAKLDSILVTSAWQGYARQQMFADPGAGFSYIINDGFRGQADVPFRLEE